MVPKFQLDFGNGWEDVPPPLNWKEGVKLEMVFTDQEPSATLQGGGFQWANTKDYATATKILARIESGLTGGLGITEGIPCQFFMPGAPNIYLFQGVLNIAEHEREQDLVTCPIKYTNAIDWFHTALEGITYFSLVAQGLADASIPPPTGFTAYIGPPGSNSKYSYKVVPYIVTQETDIAQAIMLILENISMFAHLKTAIASTVTDIKRVLADLGVSATVIYSPVGIIQGVLDILGLVAQLAWDAALIIAIIGNIEMLINQCGLLMKYKYAMTVNDIFHATFDFLNNYMGTPSGNPITFASSILDSGPYKNLTLMPRKILKENPTGIVLSLLQGGVATRGTECGPSPSFTPINNTYGYPDWNAKEVFQKLYKVFNAKCFMIGQQVRFEELHYFVAGNYKVPNTDKPGFNFNWPDKSKTNFPELKWNYEVKWQTDTSDERTMIVYTGTTCNVCTQPKLVKNPQNVLPQGGTVVALDFALAKRKEYLNFIEQAVNDILNIIAPVYNVIVGVINDITSSVSAIVDLFDPSFSISEIKTLPNNLLNALIGIMEVSNDTFNVPKFFIGTPVGNLWYVDPHNGANGSIVTSPGNYTNTSAVWANPNVPSNTPFRGEGWLSAWALMNQFHGKNLPLFTPMDQNGNKLAQINNQWRQFRKKTFPMNLQAYAAVLGSNMFFSPLNSQAKFLKLLWDPYNELAEEVDYDVSELYCLNLQTTITIDGN